VESGVPMIWMMETIMTMALQARIDFLSIYYNEQHGKIVACVHSLAKNN
jgi:hypothetical protein